MADDLYSADNVVDKTLVADRDIPIYDGPYDNANLIGTAKKGQPVGIVKTWFNPDPARNRSTLYWGFWPVSNYSKLYYAPHYKDWYSLDALRQQGVITVKEEIIEQQRKEEAANKEWYEKILDRVLPMGAAVIIGAAVIRGLISRTK